MSLDSNILNEVDSIARRERGKLLAQLLRHFGPQHIQLVEDVTQDALLSAMSVWPYQGLPSNPVAWLSRVARNRAIDRLRRESREQDYELEADCRLAEDFSSFSEEDMDDPELSTIFLCCHPKLQQLDQLAITLKIVGGFTAKEIASVCLFNEAALAKRLSRAKQRIKQTPASFLKKPSTSDIKDRLAPTLKVIYLMFSLGYAPATGERLIRRDVAFEALRLSEELTRYPLTDTPESNALLALLYFQVSRFDARENAIGEPVLFQDQNRSHWDHSLINRALHHLRSAASGDKLSRYHLEAGIACIYATAPSWSDIDWQKVLEQYQLLQNLIDSPVVTINGCVAMALSGSPEQALKKMPSIDDEPRLQDYAPFHIAMAEILRLLGRNTEAKTSYAAAMTSRVSAPVLHHLEYRLSSAVATATVESG